MSAEVSSHHGLSNGAQYFKLQRVDSVSFYFAGGVSHKAPQYTCESRRGCTIGFAPSWATSMLHLLAYFIAKMVHMLHEVGLLI